ncbi:prenylated Rab acceptor protein 1 [Lycorma delicatula]|uniref:prenylated Rab acceptor protein 1 n=1 Tax=Lycorma delicatula TaxID=130591 RepID=UPI003F51782F
MSDVEINVTGSMETPEPESKKLSDVFPMPGHVREWLSHRRQNIRPWSTFFNTNLFKSPASFQLLTRRVIRNLDYFMSNYLIVFGILTIYCLLTSPLLILAICLSFGACYFLRLRYAERQLVLFGHHLTLHQQYMLVGICSLPIYFMAGAGSAVFWVLGASFFVINLHAAFFNISALQLPDDHFLEDV